jgi:hypothetical protein
MCSNQPHRHDKKKSTRENLICTKTVCWLPRHRKSRGVDQLQPVVNKIHLGQQAVQKTDKRAIHVGPTSTPSASFFFKKIVFSFFFEMLLMLSFLRRRRFPHVLLLFVFFSFKIVLWRAVQGLGERKDQKL